MNFFERINAMTPAEALLAYLERGKSVFPVGPDKRPRVPWKIYQTAMPTVYEAKRWIDQWPDMALGFPTGSYNGFNVLDCDSPEGEEWLAANAPATPLMQRTRKGLHRFYRVGKFRVPTVSGIGPVPGIDSRGEGGYVVIAPSTIRQHQYAWEIGSRVQGVQATQTIPTLDPLGEAFFCQTRTSPAQRGILRPQGPRNAPQARHYTDDGLVAIGCRDEFLRDLIMGIVASHVRDNSTLPDPEHVALYAWEVFSAGADMSDGEFTYAACLKKAGYAIEGVGTGRILIYHDVPEDEQGFGQW